MVPQVHYLACRAPFKWNSSTKRCTYQCPSHKPIFNKDLGVCEGNYVEHAQCDTLEGNPINAFTGEKQQSFKDYVHSTNPLFVFKRTYSSSRADEVETQYRIERYKANTVTIIQPSDYKGVQKSFYNHLSEETSRKGNIQWKHNYDYKLVKIDSINYAVRLPNDQIEKFYYSSATQLLHHRHNRGEQLIANSSGYLFITTDNTYYQFSNDGLLTSIYNGLGNKVDLTYDVDNLLSTVINEMNEQLGFTYSSSSLLSKIVLPDGQDIHFTYDSYNNLSEVIYPDDTPLDLTNNPTEQYHFENTFYPYALTGITDAKKVRYSTWGYDSHGLAISSQHALNTDLISVTYDTTTNNIDVSNSLNNQKQVEFNTKGRASMVIGKSCSTSGQKGLVTFLYDNSGREIKRTDENGHITRTTYGSFNTVSQIKTAADTPLQQVTTIAYDVPLRLPNQITHPNGLIENFTYGSNGRIETHSLTADGETRTTTYIYNTDGLLASIDGSRTDINDVTNFTYTNGRLASVTNALGHTTIFENYDGFGNATKITDANGVITQYTYDVRGWLRAIDIAGRVTQFDYDAIGQLVKSTQPSGHFLSYTYDDARRLTDITNNSGENIHFTHDSEGNVTSQVIRSHDGNTQFSQQWVYDQINRLSQTVSATNQTWVNEYDVAGNLVKQITPANTELEGTFDKLKRAVQQADQADSLTNYEYDKLNQLTKVTDALGRETAYQYNGFGELITQISVDTGTTTFSYDLSGNLSAKTDERGITTTYIYDALNRLTSISYSDSSINNTTYNYDNADIGRYGIGQLTRVENNVSAIDYFYNEQGELTAEITSVNNQHTSQVYTVNYSYNADGQLKNITYPSGRIIEYTYNNIGLIEEVTSTYDGVTQTLASNIDYLPFGEMKSLTYGNGKTLTQTFNQNYQLTDKIIDSVLNKTFAYDPVNNIDFITDNLDANASEYFTYNLVDRLTEASGDYGDTSFDYDAIGNRLSKTKNNDTTNYVYQNNSQLTDVLGSSDITMTYDPSGNLLTKGNDSFTYNSEGRLNSATVNGITTNYHYNYLGQRIVKTFENGDNRYYVYDLQGLLIAELNSDAETQVEYVYVNGQRISLLMTTISMPQPSSEQFYLVNQATGFKLKASSNQAASLMIMSDVADESDWVKFTKVDSSGDYFYLQNVETGFYFRPTSNNYDAVIEQRPTNYSGNRTQWKEQVSSGDSVYLVNRWTNDYLQTLTENIDSNAIIHSTNTELSASWLLAPVVQVSTVTTQMYYVHTNHIDAPLALTDSNGDIVWQATYSPFGEITTTVDILPESFTARFPGQYSDTTTGFYYNYFRDYDPELGRYIQSDPIGLAGGINTYSYVSGNPLTYIDPLGLSQMNRSEYAPGTQWKNMTCAQKKANIARQKSIALTFATLPLGGGLVNGLLNGAYKIRVAQQIGGRPASYTWGATKQWGKRNNIKVLQVRPNQQRHHWLLQQGQGWGKDAPKWLKNQPWNINPVSSSFNNWMSKGSTNFRSLLGAPPWAKGAAGSAALIPVVSQLDSGGECGCE